MFPKISPIIPVRRADIFESADWVYEVKHDGFRALGYLDEGRSRFVSRKTVTLNFRDRRGYVDRILRANRCWDISDCRLLCCPRPFALMAAVDMSKKGTS
jgi:ATP-dependent DNA ligase